MPRSKLLPLVALWAAGVVGCAHCDICDDFPAPCSGPGCYTGGTPGAPMMIPAGAPVPVSNGGQPGTISNGNQTGPSMPPPAVEVVPPPAGSGAAAETSPPAADANVEAPK